MTPNPFPPVAQTVPELSELPLLTELVERHRGAQPLAGWRCFFIQHQLGDVCCQAQAMLAHTDLVISAWDGSRLVGFGRVLTDYVFRASIWDVIVDRAYQGQKIGTEIVRRILDHPTVQQVELFWLCTRRPGFYERLGFSAKEQTGMVWSRKDSGSQA